jgi:hypothetical protein
LWATFAIAVGAEVLNGGIALIVQAQTHFILLDGAVGLAELGNVVDELELGLGYGDSGHFGGESSHLMRAGLYLIQSLTDKILHARISIFVLN